MVLTDIPTAVQPHTQIKELHLSSPADTHPRHAHPPLV